MDMEIVQFGFLVECDTEGRSLFTQASAEVHETF